MCIKNITFVKIINIKKVCYIWRPSRGYELYSKLQIYPRNDRIYKRSSAEERGLGFLRLPFKTRLFQNKDLRLPRGQPGLSKRTHNED